MPEESGRRGPRQEDPARLEVGRAASASILAGLNVAASLIGLVVSSLIAFHFGLGRLTDAFFMAQTLPQLLTKVLQTGPLPNVFMPLFIRALETEGREAARKVAANVVVVISILTGALVVGLALLAPYVLIAMAPGFDAASRGVTVTLTWILLPTVVLMAVSGVLTAVLHACDRFMAPAVAGAVMPAMNLAVVALGVPHLGIYAPALGLLMGSVVSTAWLLILVQRAVGRPWTWNPSWRQEELQSLIRQLLPFNLVIPFAQLHLFVNRLVLSMLPPGSLAVIGFAERIFNVLVDVYTLPVVFFPVSVRQVLAGHRDDLRRFLCTSLNVNNLFAFPATLGIIALSPQLVGLLFQRGKFDREASATLSIALALIMTGLVAQGMNALFNRTLYSLGRTTDIVAGRILVNLFSVLAYGLAVPFLGVYGVAVVLGAGPFVFWAYYYRALERHLGGLRGVVFNGSLARIAACALLMGAACAAGGWLLTGSLSGAVGTVSVIGLSAALYAVLVELFRVSERELVKRLARTWLGVA